MIVDIKFQANDYLKALKPYRNGCAFNLKVKTDGALMLSPGCYLLVSLIQGSDYELWRLIDKSLEKEIDIRRLSHDEHIKEIEYKILNADLGQCQHCKGTIFFEKNQARKHEYLLPA